VSEASGRIIDVKAAILGDNDRAAASLRAELAARGLLLVGLRGSPGSGKTSLIEALLAPSLGLSARRRSAVVEADLESRVDADRLEARGIRAVQLRTGGFCHLDAAMTAAGLAELGLPGPPGKAELDLVFLENVGNLVCTAQVDPGAALDLALLSVPEGEDKPLKYPLAFARADAVILTKADYLGFGDFNLDRFVADLGSLNASAPLFVVSARTGEGMARLAAWIEGKLEATLAGAG
jgi:hydrogenase nickel incorporation protein HypB